MKIKIAILLLFTSLFSCNKKEYILKFVFSGGSGYYLATYPDKNSTLQNYFNDGGFITYTNPEKNSVYLSVIDDDLKTMKLSVYYDGKLEAEKTGTSISYTW